MSRARHEIACQQVLVEDSSVFSIQWSLFPPDIAATLTTEGLLNRYMDHIRRSTLGLIRPARTPEGIHFRLATGSVSLISFAPPETGDGTLVLRICGGLLVQPRQCHRGEMRISLEPVGAGTKVTLQLSDYCPLLLGSPSPSPLRRWLYRLTQAYIHRLVTVRFLAQLYRSLAGSRVPVRVTRVTVREGRST